MDAGLPTRREHLGKRELNWRADLRAGSEIGVPLVPFLFSSVPNSKRGLNGQTAGQSRAMCSD